MLLSAIVCALPVSRSDDRQENLLSLSKSFFLQGGETRLPRCSETGHIFVNSVAIPHKGLLQISVSFLNAKNAFVKSFELLPFVLSSSFFFFKQPAIDCTRLITPSGTVGSQSGQSRAGSSIDPLTYIR